MLLTDLIVVSFVLVWFDQAAVVERLMREAAFPSVERLRDLSGHERVVLARR